MEHFPHFMQTQRQKCVILTTKPHVLYGTRGGHCKARTTSACDSPAAQSGLLVAFGLAWMRITFCTVAVPCSVLQFLCSEMEVLKRMLLSSKMHCKGASRMRWPTPLCSLTDAGGTVKQEAQHRSITDLQTCSV